MANLIETKVTFPKAGGLAVADGAVSANAGNGLHVNPSTGKLEVPVDTSAGLGYGSNGLEVEVDGSTIDFNSAGQMTALGGVGDGLKPFMAGDPQFRTYDDKTYTVGNFDITFMMTTASQFVALGQYNDKMLSINALLFNIFQMDDEIPFMSVRANNGNITKICGLQAPSSANSSITAGIYGLTRTSKVSPYQFSVMRNEADAFDLTSYNTMPWPSNDNVQCITYLTFEI